MGVIWHKIWYDLWENRGRTLRVVAIIAIGAFAVGTVLGAKEFILKALEQSSDESGWAYLATFGGYLTKLQPDFDSRLYGYKKLSELVKAKNDLFVTEERILPGQSQKLIYLRAK